MSSPSFLRGRNGTPVGPVGLGFMLLIVGALFVAFGPSTFGAPSLASVGGVLILVGVVALVIGVVVYVRGRGGEDGEDLGDEA